MASQTRAEADALERSLADKPYKFSFLSAVRHLECRFRDRPRLGTAKRPGEELVRLGQDPYLHFAPATLASYEPGEADRPGRLSSYFFGLFGPDGPLPLHITEHAISRARHFKDRTFSRFADIFHHRLATYFYRAWAAARPTVSYDRPDQDRFANHVGALSGIGMETLRDRDAMPDLAKLFFAGHLANTTRHADGLAAMLEGFFEVPVTIEEFVPEWLELPTDCRLMLGMSGGGGVLGESATIGGSIYQCQHKFRILIGAMSLDAYQRMSPGGDSLEQLVAIVRNYIGYELDFDLQLILKRDDVPPIDLGKAGALGWTTWLSERTAETDADDMVINPGDAIALMSS
ncbi:MAG: type VI secretion system baseplate subunit TssG [Geminicoccaceae bacterium]